MNTAQAKKPLRFYLHAGHNKSRDIMSLSVMAAATGVRIYIARFLNDGRYETLKSYPFSITVRYFDLPGLGAPHLGQMMDKVLIESSLRQVRADINSGQYDLVILDEIREALVREALEPEQIHRLLQSKPAHVEIALA